MIKKNISEKVVVDSLCWVIIFVFDNLYSYIIKLLLGTTRLTVELVTSFLKFSFFNF